MYWRNKSWTTFVPSVVVVVVDVVVDVVVVDVVVVDVVVVDVVVVDVVVDDLLLLYKLFLCMLSTIGKNILPHCLSLLLNWKKCFDCSLSRKYIQSVFH